MSHRLYLQSPHFNNEQGFDFTEECYRQNDSQSVDISAPHQLFPEGNRKYELPKLALSPDASLIADIIEPPSLASAAGEAQNQQ